MPMHPGLLALLLCLSAPTGGVARRMIDAARRIPLESAHDELQLSKFLWLQEIFSVLLGTPRNNIVWILTLGTVTICCVYCKMIKTDSGLSYMCDELILLYPSQYTAEPCCPGW